MACQKVCKQGRDDIIVKVNLQSPIPTSFYITFYFLMFFKSCIICGVPIPISYCLHAIVKVMKLVDFSNSFSVYFALE